MSFLKDFEVVKLKSAIALKYKGASFISFKPDTLVQILSDHASKKFLSKLVNKTKGLDLTPIDDELITKALQLARAYTTRRRKFYRNKNIKSIDKKSKDLDYFVKAVQLVKAHNTNYKIFLDAQIEGLSFINDGKGIFPSPLQLSNTGAEDRLLQFIRDDDEENNPTEFKRLELSYSDKTTDLSDNPTYQARYTAMKKKKASLQHAYFVYDCQIALKGFATDFVDTYIEDMES